MKKKQKKKERYHRKLIKSGDIYEFYDYQIVQHRGFGKSFEEIAKAQVSRRMKKEKVEEIQKEIKEKSATLSKDELKELLDEYREVHGEEIQRREDNLNRTRRDVRRLINSNQQLTKFITLTFGEHVVDVEEANREFDKFIKRLRRRYPGVQYVCVVEFMENGRVHYHMLSDLKYVKVKTLEEIWGQGFVKINRIQKVDNVGAYVVKYMRKDVHDIRLVGRKSWFASRGLKRPEEITDNKKIAQVLAKLERHKVYEFEFETEYTGKTKYIQFNTKRKK